MKGKFKLIEGVFSAKDAKEILLTLIEEKIKFHELKSFSDEVKIGTKNNESLLKIKDLKGTRAKIIEVLNVEDTESKNFNINSFIEIERV